MWFAPCVRGTSTCRCCKVINTVRGVSMCSERGRGAGKNLLCLSVCPPSRAICCLQACTAGFEPCRHPFFSCGRPFPGVLGRLFWEQIRESLHENIAGFVRMRRACDTPCTLTVLVLELALQGSGCQGPGRQDGGVQQSDESPHQSHHHRHQRAAAGVGDGPDCTCQGKDALHPPPPPPTC